MRKDNGLICGPGGHIEAGEAPIQAAIRETQAEFGITPLSLSRLGTLGINAKSADAHCTEVFVCTEFSGSPKADNEEMCGALFVPCETLCEEFAESLFPPFKDSLLEFQKTELFVQLFDVEKSENDDIIKLSEAQEDGGPGSGNFGHKGVEGQQGGSAPNGSSSKKKSSIKRGKKPALKLSSKEYGKVMHEIDTYFHRRFEDREGKPCIIEVGKFAYVFDNDGFNTYNIYKRIMIEGNEKLIEKMREIYK